jgi:hypothetical protein
MIPMAHVTLVCRQRHHVPNETYALSVITMPCERTASPLFSRTPHCLRASLMQRIAKLRKLARCWNDPAKNSKRISPHTSASRKTSGFKIFAPNQYNLEPFPLVALAVSSKMLSAALTRVAGGVLEYGMILPD